MRHSNTLAGDLKAVGAVLIGMTLATLVFSADWSALIGAVVLSVIVVLARVAWRRGRTPLRS
jgi:hypothetical protein